MATRRVSGGLLPLVVAIAIPLAFGAVDGLAVVSSVSTWYVGLAKPSWTPPTWVFAPAWTTLYILLGVAAWLVWREGINEENPKVAAAIKSDIRQFILNFFWPILFFYLRSPALGLVDIVVLWGFAFLTLMQFFKVSSLAGLLMVPYLAWITYATALNAGVWWLNR